MSVVAGVDSSTQSCKVELRRLSDGKLLVLVNWHIMHAWNQAVREFNANDVEAAPHSAI